MYNTGVECELSDEVNGTTYLVVERNIPTAQSSHSVHMTITGARLLAERNTFFKRLEDGDDEALELFNRFRSINIESYINIIGRMGINFDEYPPESKSNGACEQRNSNPKAIRVFEIPGLLGTHSANALGDYAAKENFMRKSFAIKLGLKINYLMVKKFIIGSGEKITTSGVVTSPFRFNTEKEEHSVIFHLIPDCIHDVILGKHFLKATRTFSDLPNFARRVKERIIRGIPQFHLLYLDNSSPRFEGFINGSPQTALADSGSTVMIMDEAYARSRGLSIDTRKEHRIRLRFADNSTTYTSGFVTGIEWRFGRDLDTTSPVHTLGFYILKNSPTDVILCDTFLFDTGAFSKYNDYLVDDEDEDNESCFLAIDVDKHQPAQGTYAARPTLFLIKIAMLM